MTPLEQYIEAEYIALVNERNEMGFTGDERPACPDWNQVQGAIDALRHVMGQRGTRQRVGLQMNEGGVVSGRGGIEGGVVPEGGGSGVNVATSTHLHRWRRAGTLAQHPLFERVVEVVIFVNVGIISLELFTEGHEVVLEKMNAAILTVYILEMALKMLAGGFWSKKGNWFELAVVVISVLPFLWEGLQLFRMARFTKLMHLTKLSQLRAAWHLKMHAMRTRTEWSLRGESAEGFTFES